MTAPPGPTEEPRSERGPPPHTRRGHAVRSTVRPRGTPSRGWWWAGLVSVAFALALSTHIGAGGTVSASPAIHAAAGALVATAAAPVPQNSTNGSGGDDGSGDGSSGGTSGGGNGSISGGSSNTSAAPGNTSGNGSASNGSAGNYTGSESAGNSSEGGGSDGLGAVSNNSLGGGPAGGSGTGSSGINLGAVGVPAVLAVLGLIGAVVVYSDLRARRRRPPALARV